MNRRDVLRRRDVSPSATGARRVCDLPPDRGENVRRSAPFGNPHDICKVAVAVERGYTVDFLRCSSSRDIKKED